MKTYISHYDQLSLFTMKTSENKTHIAGRIPPEMMHIVVEARNMGYKDSEIVREGIRLFAKERGILVPANSRDASTEPVTV